MRAILADGLGANGNADAVDHERAVASS